MKKCLSPALASVAVLLIIIVQLSWRCPVSWGQTPAGRPLLEGPQFDELVLFLDSFDPEKIHKLQTLMKHSPDEALQLAAALYAEMQELLRLKEENPEIFWRTVRLSQLAYQASRLAGECHRAEYEYQKKLIRQKLHAVLSETFDLEHEKTNLEALGESPPGRGENKAELVDEWLDNLLLETTDKKEPEGPEIIGSELLAEEWGKEPTNSNNFLYRTGMMIEHIESLKGIKDFEVAVADQLLRQINMTYEQGNRGQARKLLDKLYAHVWQTTMARQGRSGGRAVRRLGKPAILMIDGFPSVDDTYVCGSGYRMKLDQMGYRVDTCRWAEITWDLLKQFNVLVLMWHPGGSDEAYIESDYRPAFPLLFRFMEEGGGIFVLGGDSGDYELSINGFIESLNAKILPEVIADNAVQYTQPDHLLLDFALTDNTVRHPVTSGVAKVWYCVGESWSKLGTRALQVDPTWTVIMKGSRSSFSRARDGSLGAYSTAPPMMVCRSYKQGRIVIFAAHPSFWITDPYHLVWEEISIGRGHGFRLLTNVYNWLGKPSQETEALGGFKPAVPPAAGRPVHHGDIYAQLSAIGHNQPVELAAHETVKLNSYSGIIGVYSSYSKGSANVSGCVREAKRLGYDFIVFTEDCALMNEISWDKLAADCSAFSDGEFLALPGLSYEGIREGGSFVVFGIDKWPSFECFDGAGKGDPSVIARVHDNPPNWLMTPTSNPVKPWFLSGYNGLEVVSYNRGSQIFDRAFDEYRYLQSNTYDLIPVVSHRIFDPGEMSKIEDYKVHVLCETLAGVPVTFKSRVPGSPNNVYISSGPKIHEWVIENAFEASREEAWRVSLDVSSDQPLRDITIYDGEAVYRVLRPAASRFSYEMLGHHERQHAFTMVVCDEAGKVAYSSCLSTSDIRQKFCLDRYRENTGIRMAMLDRHGHFTILRTGLEVPPAGEVAGGGIITPWYEVMPRGIVVQPTGFNIHFSHRIFNPLGKEKTAIGRRNILFASGDVSILDNHLAMSDSVTPTPLADTRVRLMVFNPRPYSYSMVLVESDVSFKKNFSFGNTKGPDLVTVRVMEKNRWDHSFRSYTYIDEHGLKKTGNRGASVRGVIKQGGYVSVGTDLFGAVALYPLTAGSHDFIIDKRGLLIGYEMGGWPVKTGRIIRDRFLVVRGLPGESDTQGFDMIRKAYGFDGPPAYQITLSHGRVDETRGVPVLAARDYYIEGEINQAHLPNELPVCVTELNPHWDAGMLDKETGIIRRVGVCEANSTGYLTVDTSTRRSFIIGNLLTCDNKAVRLAVLGREDAAIEFEAHNPTEEPVRLKVQSPIYKGLNESVSLAGGESKRIKAVTAPR